MMRIQALYKGYVLPPAPFHDSVRGDPIPDMVFETLIDRWVALSSTNDIAKLKVDSPWLQTLTWANG